MPIAGKILTFIASIAISYALKKVFERGKKDSAIT
jgi:hypothetical protein